MSVDPWQTTYVSGNETGDSSHAEEDVNPAFYGRAAGFASQSDDEESDPEGYDLSSDRWWHWEAIATREAILYMFGTPSTHYAIKQLAKQERPEDWSPGRFQTHMTNASAAVTGIVEASDVITAKNGAQGIIQAAF